MKGSVSLRSTMCPKAGVISGLAAVMTLLAVLLVSSASAEVFTSSEKLVRLAEMETSLMARLQSYRHRDIRLPLYFAKRVQAFHRLPREKFLRNALHPNGAYLLIKSFVETWPSIISSDPAFWSLFSNTNSEMPTRTDLDGTLSAMLRLQRVYGLTVVDMYSGNYSGFFGPRLSFIDSYRLGRQAFVDGLLRESIAWLEFADAEFSRLQRWGTMGIVGKNHTEVTMLEVMTSRADFWSVPTPQEKAAMLGLLGRAHFHAGHKAKARSLYETSMQLDSRNGDVIQLGKELLGIFHQKQVYENQDWHRRMDMLCSRNQHQRVDKLRRFHRCKYRPSLVVPFVKYKQEVISLAPYIAIFYDVISEREIKAMKEHVVSKMVRGRVQNREATGYSVSHERICEMGWVQDTELKVVWTVSQRIKDFTGMEVDQRLPHGPSSSEGFQIINYGMGGHHNSHYDPVKIIDQKALEKSGNRLATIVIYLTDVEIGGHTVFLRTGVSIAPVKGMAVLWYNYSPALRLDHLTLHAGCPVLKGQKWIANKWIWTYGNTFRRPCGSTVRSSHAYVDRLLMSSAFK